jgi:hypothetical protein
MWLAVAAMAVVSLARVDAANATVYTNPVLAFLAGQQNSSALTVAGVPKAIHPGSARKSSMFLHDAGPGAWTAVLPVLFVGLVVPLNLASPRPTLSLGRTPLAPALPCSFQRPPPALL